MKTWLVLDNDFLDQISEGWVFVDNDFLTALFESKELIEKIVKHNPSIVLLIDPLTKFEFLRDVIDLEQRELKEKFLANEELFSLILNKHEHFSKAQENAIEISRPHASIKPQIPRPDTVDLLLTARVFLHSGKLVTGNKKHFSAFMFDVKSSFLIHDHKNEWRDFYVLTSNHKKYNKLAKEFN